MPVGEMLRRMDSAEITEWLAYYMIESQDEKKARLEAEANSKLNARRRRG